MSDEQNSYDILAQDAVDRSVYLRAKELASNTEKIAMLKELAAVFLKQYTELFYQAVDAVASQNEAEFRRTEQTLLAEFQARGCSIVADEKLTADNPASIRFENGSWQLRVHPEHMSHPQFEVMREYIHELAALSMVQHLAEKQKTDLNKPGALEGLKQSLFADNKGQLAATNVIDILFRMESGRM